MSTQTKEAPSVTVTREELLRRIPQFEIRPIFLREHLGRELVIGTIGERGGGKSASDAVIGLVDFMLAGKPVWSNMLIRCDIEIDDATARKYGLNRGGIAHYESEPLEKNALLALDERYRGGCLVIEEINVQYSNVRRFMSNTNVDFNEVCQQLRKFQTSLIYNVIDEMFIDIQLRGLSDVFIKTYDTAFNLDSLTSRKQTGIDFNWKVYPMSGYIAGEQGKYTVTKKPLPSIFLHFAPWQGIFDTWRHQEKGVYSMSTKEKQAALRAGVSAESSPEMIDALERRNQLESTVIMLKKRGFEYLQPHQLRGICASVGCSFDEIKDELLSYGVYYDRFKQAYRIDNFNIEELIPKRQRDAAAPK